MKIACEPPTEDIKLNLPETEPRKLIFPVTVYVLVAVNVTVLDDVIAVKLPTVNPAVPAQTIFC